MSRILIISQVFYPDLSAVSQILTDLSEEIALKGYRVDVLTSRYAYDNPKNKFGREELYENCHIHRISNTKFKKNNSLGRVCNFISFNLNMLFRLAKIEKRQYQLIIGTTTPPFLSFIGIIMAKLKKIPFFFYAMDLQPELAIISGYMKENSIIAMALMKIGDFIYRKSSMIIALDQYMANYIIRRGANKKNVFVIPLWPVMNCVYTGERLENPFRKERNLGGKIVIMYSGNMSVVHPMNTLLEAARRLKDDDRFVFVFIGEGIRKNEIEKFKCKNGLSRIILLPLQPREYIHISLGAADIQVVIHGNRCTGYTHPSKIYGALFIGKPILYIGERPSHIDDILIECSGNISVRHGETTRLIEALIRFAEQGEEEGKRVGQRNREYALPRFSRVSSARQIIEKMEHIIN